MQWISFWKLWYVGVSKIRSKTSHPTKSQVQKPTLNVVLHAYNVVLHAYNAVLHVYKAVLHVYNAVLHVYNADSIITRSYMYITWTLLNSDSAWLPIFFQCFMCVNVSVQSRYYTMKSVKSILPVYFLA